MPRDEVQAEAIVPPAGVTDAQAARREEDQRLVEATLAGDPQAFATLFERYREKVYAVTFRYARNKTDALDLTQDAFVKAYEKLSTFGGRSGFYTWITQIAINLAIDFTRKRKRRKVVSLEEHHTPEQHVAAASPPEAPGRALVDQELQTKYEHALEQLSEKHRTVFVLHTVEGLAYKEIANTLEISIGTVMSRLHYARKRLQGLLADYLGR